MAMTFLDFCRSHGIIPPQFIEPGKTYRAATEAKPNKKNGLIRLDADCAAGVIFNYETGEGGKVWKSDGPRVEIDHEKANAARSERLAEKRERERAGTARAFAEYEAATDLVGIEVP